MSLDHSLTYTQFKFKNIPHRLRLKKILAVLSKQDHYKTLIDVGCSNGYLTNIIGVRFNIDKIRGVDYDQENLVAAKEKYPHISFGAINLNVPVSASDFPERYELVTCFETLEHVGDLSESVTNLLKLKSDEGTLLISVPIEIGLWGATKFLLKRVFYSYPIDELGNIKLSGYLLSLVKGENIAKYRIPAKQGWYTHFGFDYRNIDKILSDKGVTYTAYNSFTTRFYIIRIELNKSGL